MAEGAQTKDRPRPVFAIGIGLLSVLFICWSASPDYLAYERAAILRGEIWRLWTGHLVHFGVSHLAWDLAVFLVAGLWIESVDPRRTRILLAIAPPVIGLALLAFEPGLARYGGLSGVATGVVTLLALRGWFETRGQRYIWGTLLLLPFLKTGLEFGGTEPIFADFAGRDIHAVPLAHLAGMVTAAAVFVTCPRVVQDRRPGHDQ